MPSAEYRVAALEKATGQSPADENRVKADAAEVEAKITSMAKRCDPLTREQMQEWWAMCRVKVRSDPLLAKVFAGFEPGDVDL